MKLSPNALAAAIGISATSLAIYSGYAKLAATDAKFASLQSEIAALKGTKASVKQAETARLLRADRILVPEDIDTFGLVDQGLSMNLLSSHDLSPPGLSTLEGEANGKAGKASPGGQTSSTSPTYAGKSGKGGKMGKAGKAGCSIESLAGTGFDLTVNRWDGGSLESADVNVTFGQVVGTGMVNGTICSNGSLGSFSRDFTASRHGFTKGGIVPFLAVNIFWEYDCETGEIVLGAYNGDDTWSGNGTRATGLTCIAGISNVAGASWMPPFSG